MILKEFFEKVEDGLVFMTSALNLVVKTTFYSREQVLVYIFFTVA